MGRLKIASKPRSLLGCQTLKLCPSLEPQSFAGSACSTHQFTAEYDYLVVAGAPDPRPLPPWGFILFLWFPLALLGTHGNRSR